jgi:hypothetical protein
MGQSPSWEANSHSASQEISRPLWDQKVHNRVHKSPLLAPVQSHMNPEQGADTSFNYVMPAPVAVRYKPRMVLDRSNTGIVGSNPARGMNVRIFCCGVLWG